jgi:threonine dehydrogenase-like Zn-dependent dehydrogenase
MAQKCAWLKGASRVIALDVEDYRLAKSRAVAKTETINVNDKDWLEQVRAMTGGRGTDVAIDAVGMEAHHGLLGKLKNIVHLEVGSLNGLRFAFEAVRRGGTVSIVGVYGVSYDNFPIGQLFDKGVRLAMGQAPVHAVIDELMEHVVKGRLKADDVITHRVPLIEAPAAYEIFNGKKDGCVKVVLKP